MKAGLCEGRGRSRAQECGELAIASVLNCAEGAPRADGSFSLIMARPICELG